MGKLLAPPEKLKVSEWAGKYRILAQESSSEPGKWRNERTPYLREIMDTARDRSVKEIVIMSSAQVGKSECLLNVIAYHIDIEPCPILLLQPTIQMAEDFSKDRIGPMVRLSPRLSEKIAVSRSREGTNTILHKTFPGGHLVVSGSNSPASLASRPIRLLAIDEVDRMEATSEGDPVALAEKRTITFHNRLVIKVSTPTIKDISRIERAFNRSDKRYFFVPCPHCGQEQRLEWKNVTWEKDADGKGIPSTACYQCSSCQKKWTEGERLKAIQSGKWHKTSQSEVAGFHISELYSLFRKLSDIVKDFLDKKENPETLRVWVNTTLGEPFSVKTITVPWQNILARCEKYPVGTIPKGGVFLTAGADVQEDRIHIEVVAWGRNFETWSIEYIVLFGDTSGKEVWLQLDKIAQKTWKLSDGNNIGLSRLCIDAGFNTVFVHNWVRQYPSNRVFPVIGRDGLKAMLAPPSLLEVHNGKHRYRGLKSYPVGISIIKQEVYGFLRQNAPVSGSAYPFGYCHFPKYPENFFQELTAEDYVKTSKNGFARYEWRKSRPRNEALDCRVYARAAACMLGIDRFSEEDWLRLEKEYPPALQKKAYTPGPQVKATGELSEESFWED